MGKQTTYSYKNFPFLTALAYVDGLIEKDAYFARDNNGNSKEDWDKALNEGYRWIRTDGEFAILEKVNN